jgi:hypothetical protein
MMRGLWLLLWVGWAQAQPRPWAEGVTEEHQARALRLFKEGNQLFEESQHAAAVARYRQAIDVWDHPAIHYNLAVALIHLDQPLEAYHHLEPALKFGAAPLGNENYGQALTYKKLLIGQLARLKVICREADAEVSLDGSRLFRAPGEANRLTTPGQHQLTATKRDYLTESHPLLLMPGKETVLTLTLTPLKTLAQKRRWPVWKPWVVAAAGVAIAAAVAVPLYVQASSDFRSYDDEVARCAAQNPLGGCDRSTLSAPVQKLVGKAEAERDVGIAAFAAGGALALAGVALVIANQPRVVERKVSLLVGPASLGLAGRF